MSSQLGLVPTWPLLGSEGLMPDGGGMQRMFTGIENANRM
jgi:hypothetical protein